MINYYNFFILLKIRKNNLFKMSNYVRVNTKSIFFIKPFFRKQLSNLTWKHRNSKASLKIKTSKTKNKIILRLLNNLTQQQFVKIESRKTIEVNALGSLSSDCWLF